MPTKYILHGGFQKGPQANDSFTKEILKTAPQESNILLVYFAERPEAISTRNEEDLAQFNKNKGNKILHFQTANEENFIEQIKWADIIYLHGGRTLRLLETLKKFPNFGESIKAKIVAGDSAGANALTISFYSRSADSVFDGLSILPIKLICHYSDEYKNIFKDETPNTKIIFLPEYQFKVFEN